MVRQPVPGVCVGIEFDTREGAQLGDDGCHPRNVRCHGRSSYSGLGIVSRMGNSKLLTPYP
jgi:hypothetical protein